VTETVSLGEKRFVAVIQIDGSQYLIGGGATNVALLAKLKEKDSFRDLLNDTLAVSQLQTDVPAVEEMREHS
jgi:flagellar biogenesis protein FliO